MDDVKNQRAEIVKTIGLLLLITFLGGLLVGMLVGMMELEEATYLLWIYVIIPAITIAIIGAIVYLVKNAPVYRSFLKRVFKVWLIIHIIWSVFSIWFIALSNAFKYSN